MSDLPRDAAVGGSGPDFHPHLSVPDDATGEPFVIAVHRSSVLLAHPDEVGLTVVDTQVIGVHRGAGVIAHDVGHDTDVPPGLFTPLMGLYGRVDEELWHVVGRAVQLVEWRRTHRFCGRCGAPTELSTLAERAAVCSTCGLKAYPRLAPAAIVLVERDDGRILLARNANFPVAMYSLLAGFVEPGETLEACAIREVREEVGIDITDVRYAGSQPWPFPHSLMIGFTARYAGGELCLDPAEIADANWYAPDELPMIPPRMSIARTIIDAWLAGRQGG